MSSAFSSREKQVTIRTVLFYAPFVYACWAIWLSVDPIRHLVSITWGLGIFMIFLFAKRWLFPKPSGPNFAALVVGFVVFGFLQIQVYRYFDVVVAIFMYSIANWYLHLLVSAEERNPSVFLSLIQWAVTGMLLLHLFVLFSGGDFVVLLFLLIVTGIAVHIGAQDEKTR